MGSFLYEAKVGKSDFAEKVKVKELIFRIIQTRERNSIFGDILTDTTTN